MGKSSKSWQRAIIVPSLMYHQAFLDIKEAQGFEAYDALFQFDGVHWSNAGYDVFYALLEKEILALTENF